MKKIVLGLSLTMCCANLFSQVATPSKSVSMDTLDRALKLKQIEVIDKELDIKLKQYEIEKKNLELQQERLEIEKVDRIDEQKKYEALEQERSASRKKILEEEQKKEEDSKRYKNFNTLIFVEPLPLFIGTFQGGLEKTIMPQKTLRASIGVNYVEDPVLYYDERNTTLSKGFKLELQYRNYIMGENKGNEGFYVGAYGYMKTLQRQIETQIYNGSIYADTQFTVSGKAASLGVLMGYNVFLVDKLTVDMYLGAGLIRKMNDFRTADLSIPVLNSFANGTTVRFGLSVGLPSKSKK